AHDRLFQFLSQKPYEDLEFARVDHHRNIRQGFPEVIFGQGKSPSQIAAIAARIVAAGHSLLVTRTTPEAHEAVVAEVPGATYNAHARCITLDLHTASPGRGTILIAPAGTADLPIPEQPAITAHFLGTPPDRL